jgi:hypothetical protein
MGVTRCETCGVSRARKGNTECSVCYLLRVLVEEHVEGEHDAVANASCIDCTRSPEYASEVRAHRQAMRRQDAAQTALRERRRALYGDGSPTGRLSTKQPVMQIIRPTTSGQIDHSQCDHERTAKARAACRRAHKTV